MAADSALALWRFGARASLRGRGAEIRNVAADAAAAAHDGRLCEISNAGHLVNLEQPPEFLRAAQAFIETAS